MNKIAFGATSADWMFGSIADWLQAHQMVGVIFFILFCLLLGWIRFWSER